MSTVRRVRSHAGQFALLAVLALVAALLVTAAPRLANRLADQGLREQIADQPAAVRDISYRQEPDSFGRPVPVLPERAGRLSEWQDAMPAPLRGLIDQRWYAAETVPATIGGPGVPPNAPRIDLAVRASTGAAEAVTMVSGRWPSAPAGRGPTEVALAADVAEKLGLRLGARLRLAPKSPTASPLEVVLAGLYRPVDPAAGVWDSLPSPLRVTEPACEGCPFVGVALTTDPALVRLEEAGWPITFSWRYRISPQRLDTEQVGPLIDAVRRLTPPPLPHAVVARGIDIPLERFARSLATTRAVLTIVTAGVLATLFGLVVLAARLAGRRRAAEYALLAARGASRRRIAGRSLAESLLVVPVAALAGWAAGLAVPGRPAATGWLVLVAAAVTVLAPPVATLATRPAAGARRDLLRLRPSARRVTLEVSVLALAALGTFLLRRRGLPAAGTVDPLLAGVPVLLAIGAATLALRGYPWPLRLSSRLAARARGSVVFLGLARAGRGTVTGPLVVVVLAVGTAAFCGAVAGGVADGRDRAAGLAVPADALLTGDRFAPETTDELAGVPGVRSVAPLLRQADQKLSWAGAGPRSPADPVSVLVVDGPAFARVAADSGAAVDLPAALTGAASGTGPVPAVVSPAVAADLPGPATVTAQERRYEFRAAAVASSFPLVAPGTERFVVLPWQALRPAAERPLIPTGFVLAGTGLDARALREVGDAGQARYFGTGLVTASAPERPAEVTYRSTVRAELDRGGANGLLSFGFVAGASGGAGLGLLAVAFAVLAGARARGRVLSRLRTMGLSRPQWRGLLLVELAPLVGAAVLTGAVVGVLMPLLLTPALGLSAFTDGVPVRPRFDPALLGGVVALGVLALGVALLVEALNNRRMRLGEVLRLGEES
ncbi:FtsX-like permease family protein [Micromonospora sp. NPDC049559]|uniref:FtsX-like permease family protein n=1 Tax=Micromonospora sp. NPDC049559 TaxID=3155923 RepID=UPI003414911E